MPFLKEQIRLISPAIIVCVGRISAQRFIDADFRMMRQHGQFILRDGVLMMGTIHPAALLRDPGKRPETFEDLKTLEAMIKSVCVHTL
jgi:DNA polymerase